MVLDIINAVIVSVFAVSVFMVVINSSEDKENRTIGFVLVLGLGVLTVVNWVKIANTFTNFPARCSVKHWGTYHIPAICLFIYFE